MAEKSNTMEERNESQRRTIEKLVNENKGLKEELCQADIWSRFAGYLLDNCEGQEITEESLQGWMSDMLQAETAARKS